MQIPRTATPAGSIAPISGVGVSLHEFVHVSWHVLMPYTLLGVVLMAYSQTRLLRGQRALKRESVMSVEVQSAKA